MSVTRPSPRAGDRGRSPASRPDYAGAVAHYTSPRRRDAVKRRWEEPLLRRLLGDVLGRVDVDPARPLKVLDVGCGTGGGLGLLDATAEVRRRPGPLEYVGLDLDPHLLAVAREQHADDPRARFVEQDVRDGMGDPDVDVYLSTGVPWSHLTPDELRRALTHVLAAARHRDRPAAVVIDVLGRYSLEWPTRWASSRWTYRMSFFEGDDEPPTAEMTTYGGSELLALVAGAAEDADCPLAHLRAVDRSLLVGRHSATGDYAPDLPPVRSLVNELWDPEVNAELPRLRLGVDLPPAPPEIVAFHAAFVERWNRAVAEAGTTPAPQAELAERLRELEARHQRGLGTGHSLTVTAITRPA